MPSAQYAAIYSQACAPPALHSNSWLVMTRGRYESRSSQSSFINIPNFINDEVHQPTSPGKLGYRNASWGSKRYSKNLKQLSKRPLTLAAPTHTANDSERSPPAQLQQSLKIHYSDCNTTSSFPVFIPVVHHPLLFWVSWELFCYLEVIFGDFP